MPFTRSWRLPLGAGHVQRGRALCLLSPSVSQQERAALCLGWACNALASAVWGEHSLLLEMSGLGTGPWSQEHPPPGHVCASVPGGAWVPACLAAWSTGWCRLPGGGWCTLLGAAFFCRAKRVSRSPSLLPHPLLCLTQPMATPSRDTERSSDLPETTQPGWVRAGVRAVGSGLGSCSQPHHLPFPEDGAAGGCKNPSRPHAWELEDP